jgi:ribosomal protein L16 Arg81 hydroxylase
MANSQGEPKLDLAALLAPLTVDRFVAEHWERRPLHQRRGEPGFYASILTTDDLERLISAGDLRFPAIQLARHGGYFPPEVYTTTAKHGTETWSGVPDVARIQAEYAAGATVVLPALQRAWAPLRALCLELSAELSHAVHANAYLTPAGTTGFLPHYDTHDVFVLQVGGRKRWRVHAPPLRLPHHTQHFVRSEAPLPPLVGELELDAGDLLYLPRGYVHHAETSDRFSAHVTIGVTVYTWVELLAELAKASRERSRFREALPIGFARPDAARDRARLRDGLVDRIGELLSQVDYDGVVEDLVERVRSARPEPARFHADTRVGEATESEPRARRPG